MKEIITKIIIDTKPEKVWEVLTDFENYPTWNPFIQKISGEQKVGLKLDVSIHPLEGNGMTFQPTLLKFEENREFRWVGKLLVKGILVTNCTIAFIKNYFLAQLSRNPTILLNTKLLAVESSSTLKYPKR